MSHTFLHCSPLCAAIGPLIPKAAPLNHQKVRTMMDASTPNTIFFVFFVYRLEEKIK